MYLPLIQTTTFTKPPIDIKNDHIIGKIVGAKPGPTVVFLGAIHGNEPAGLLGLKQLMEDYHNDPFDVCGTIYAIAGNLQALKSRERYIKSDLNRMWNTEAIDHLLTLNEADLSYEQREQKELWDTIQDIKKKHNGPIYFMDIHTTSSSSIPFLTINDQLLNRAFCKQYPLPIILGIEEFITGPFLSYINELGYVAFGFEAGQHDDPKAVHSAISFIYLSLVYTQSITLPKTRLHKYTQHLLKTSKGLKQFYEIYERYQIAPLENFKMLPNFYNFEHIHEGQALAVSNQITIKATNDTTIFMPLYQGKGEDGYYLIRPIPKLFLGMSKWIRRLKIDRILPLLPGVNFDSKQKNALVVDKRWAFLFRKQFLHLMGYRTKTLDKLHLRAKNREAASKKKLYKKTNWY
ncbi:MAG: succinylglutamate desuccinylase/aspartoacylase family protein [Gilvibacter sp.]